MSEHGAAPTGSTTPASLTWALRTLAALGALGLVATVLIVLLRDELIRTWAMGRSDMRRVLETQGLDAIKDGAVHPPAFVPVAIVLFIVVSGLIWVLSAFLRGGFGWARVCLTVLLFFLLVGTVAGLRTGAPAVFAVISVASFPIEAAAVFFMWHKDTTGYLRGTPVVRREDLGER
jgi:hypothetical protein